MIVFRISRPSGYEAFMSFGEAIKIIFAARRGPKCTGLPFCNILAGKSRSYLLQIDHGWGDWDVSRLASTYSSELFSPVAVAWAKQACAPLSSPAKCLAIPL